MITVKKTLYIFMGPPGSGKGSLAALCTDRLGWKHLSTGNMCREEIARNSEIGKQIDFTIKSGKLISDSLIVQMVAKALGTYFKQDTSLILDGFPRNVPQAKELNRILDQENFADICVIIIHLSVSDEIIIKRIARRLVCPNPDCQAVYAACDKLLDTGTLPSCDRCATTLSRRSDDSRHIIEERLKQYHQEEKLLLDYFNSKNYSVCSINLEVPLEKAFQQLRDLVGITRDDHN